MSSSNSHESKAPPPVPSKENRSALPFKMTSSVELPVAPADDKTSGGSVVRINPKPSLLVTQRKSSKSVITPTPQIVSSISTNSNTNQNVGKSIRLFESLISKEEAAKTLEYGAKRDPREPQSNLVKKVTADLERLRLPIFLPNPDPPVEKDQVKGKIKEKDIKEKPKERDLAGSFPLVITGIPTNLKQSDNTKVLSSTAPTLLSVPTSATSSTSSLSPPTAPATTRSNSTLSGQLVRPFLSSIEPRRSTFSETSLLALGAPQQTSSSPSSSASSSSASSTSSLSSDDTCKPKEKEKESASVASVLEYQFPPLEYGPTPTIPSPPETTQRDLLAYELYTSEYRYLRSLDILLKYFIIPLRETSSPYSNLLPEEDMRQIFGITEIIRSFNANLLAAIETRIREWHDKQLVGDIFVTLHPFFRMYTQYCNNYEPAVATLVKCMKVRPFAAFLEELLQKPECAGLELRSYLIMPVQRLPRYVMLLGDLQKKTDPSHPDYQNLITSLEKLKEVTGLVNTSIRSAERSKKFRERKTITHLVAPHRTWLEEGVVILQSVAMVTLFYQQPSKEKTKPSTVNLLLFNDLLCFETKDTLEETIPLEAVWLEPQDDLLVIRTPEKIFTLSFPNENEKKLASHISAALIRHLSLPEDSPETATQARKFKIKFQDNSSYDGEWLNGQMSGKGKFIFPSGNVYDGEWSKNLMEGGGSLIFESGDKYLGQWSNAKPHGEGTYISTSGTVYTGEWKQGKKHGKGELHYSQSGDVLKGEWFEDVVHGHGSLIMKNGDYYKGFWKNNRRDGEGEHKSGAGVYKGTWEGGRRVGQGTMKYSNGDSYTGHWIDNLAHGSGVLECSHGRYEGNWENGKKHGQGSFFYANGDTYVGTWHNDQRSGEGTFTNWEGVYEGNWALDVRSGEGRMSYKDNRRYTGKWLDNKRHGTGTMTFPDGKYEGEWVNDKREGRGVLVTLTGRYQGAWLNDKAHGHGTFTSPNNLIFEGEWLAGLRNGRGYTKLGDGKSVIQQWNKGTLESSYFGVEFPPQLPGVRELL